jgi:hypothetical protein
VQLSILKWKGKVENVEEAEVGGWSAEGHEKEDRADKAVIHDVG